MQKKKENAALGLHNASILQKLLLELVELVLELPALLVCQSLLLLSVFQLFLDVLDGLLGILCAKRRLDFDLVASSVVDDLENIWKRIIYEPYMILRCKEYKHLPN